MKTKKLHVFSDSPMKISGLPDNRAKNSRRQCEVLGARCRTWKQLVGATKSPACSVLIGESEFWKGGRTFSSDKGQDFQRAP
jgi:hypothetical protein